MVEEARAGDRLAGVAGQVLEYRELARGERDGHSGSGHLVRGGIDDEVADLQAHRPLRGSAAHQRAQPGQQLAEVEGLDQVVVGADVEAADAVVQLSARGEHEDRRPAVALAQHAADLEAVAVGQHHVQDDAVVVPHGCLRQRAVAVADHVDGVALVAQPTADGPRQLRVVLDEQQPHVAPCGQRRRNDTSSARSSPPFNVASFTWPIPFTYHFASSTPGSSGVHSSVISAWL
jgi:hypothetical protein